MNADRYSLVFVGQLAANVALETARNRVRESFRLDEVQLDKLFSGRRVVVKRDVGLCEARRYQAAFRRSGGIALVEPSGTGPAPGSRAETAMRPEPPPIGKAALDHAGLTLAPVGALLDGIDDRGPAQRPDTAALSLVPGTDWSLEDCEPPTLPPPVIDIDDLELAPF